MTPSYHLNRAVRRSIGGWLILLVLATAGVTTLGQSPGRSLLGIERLRRQVDDQILESETQGEYSSIFRNELVLNQRSNPWPAVGIYQKAVRFFYTFGDREKNPYPDRLLKITVTTERSNRSEYSEYVFDEAGQLVYCVEAEDVDAVNGTRFYFAGGRLIAAYSGPREMSIRDRSMVEAAQSARLESRKLVAIFRNSLE